MMTTKKAPLKKRRQIWLRKWSTTEVVLFLVILSITQGHINPQNLADLLTLFR